VILPEYPISIRLPTSKGCLGAFLRPGALAIRGGRDSDAVGTATITAPLAVPVDIIISAGHRPDPRIVQISRSRSQSLTGAAAWPTIFAISALVPPMVAPLITAVISPVVVRSDDANVAIAEVELHDLGDCRSRQDAQTHKHGGHARQQSQLFRFHVFLPAGLKNEFQFSVGKMNGSITSSIPPSRPPDNCTGGIEGSSPRSAPDLRPNGECFSGSRPCVTYKTTPITTAGSASRPIGL